MPGSGGLGVLEQGEGARVGRGAGRAGAQSRVRGAG